MVWLLRKSSKVVVWGVWILGCACSCSGVVFGIWAFYLRSVVAYWLCRNGLCFLHRVIFEGAVCDPHPILNPTRTQTHTRTACDFSRTVLPNPELEQCLQFTRHAPADTGLGSSSLGLGREVTSSPSQCSVWVCPLQNERWNF